MHFTGTGNRNRRLGGERLRHGRLGRFGRARSHADFEDGAGVRDPRARPRLSVSSQRCQNYLEEALDGSFQEGREESTEEYQLAETLRRRGRTRHPIPPLPAHQQGPSPSGPRTSRPARRGHSRRVPRLGHRAPPPRARVEPRPGGTPIDLTEWAPDRSTGAARCPTAAVPRRLSVRPSGAAARRPLRTLRQPAARGQRALVLERPRQGEQGHHETVMSEPDTFLAYNNGITATATGVAVTTTADRSQRSRICRSSTAVRRPHHCSTSHREQQATPPQFDDVSRAGQARRRVARARTGTGSEHLPVREQPEQGQRGGLLLQQPLPRPHGGTVTPDPYAATPGVTFQTKWFYERTRGQYLNEKAKLCDRGGEEVRRRRIPRNQVITKTDAAKYAVSWAQQAAPRQRWRAEELRRVRQGGRLRSGRHRASSTRHTSSTSSRRPSCTTRSEPLSRSSPGTRADTSRTSSPTPSRRSRTAVAKAGRRQVRLRCSVAAPRHLRGDEELRTGGRRTGTAGTHLRQSPSRKRHRVGQA